MSTFAYLVTIHNSEHCLMGTLDNLYANKSYGSEVIAILDGCTDTSEEIVDRYPKIIKLYTPDVHEILALNAGLRYIQEHDLASYAITVQDDLWQLDPDFENLTLKMFHDHPKLGHLTYRLGVNFGPDFPNDPTDMCENCSSPTGFGTTLAIHQYAKRMVVGKTPSCIPIDFVRKHGLLDENLAPRGHDDTELSLRILSFGLENMVLATRWRSDLNWGGTRRKTQPTIEQDARNATYIKNKYGDVLNSFTITEEYQRIHNFE